LLSNNLVDPYAAMRHRKALMEMLGTKVFSGKCSFAPKGDIGLGLNAMKVRNSLKSLRTRHRANQLVRRKGRVYIINKVQKRYKARQG